MELNMSAEETKYAAVYNGRFGLYVLIQGRAHANAELVPPIQFKVKRQDHLQWRFRTDYKVSNDWLKEHGLDIPTFFRTYLPHLKSVTMEGDFVESEYVGYLGEEQIRYLWVQWALGKGDRPIYDGWQTPQWAELLRCESVPATEGAI